MGIDVALATFLSVLSFSDVIVLNYWSLLSLCRSSSRAVHDIFAGSIFVDRCIRLCFLSLMLVNFGFTHSSFKFLTGLG